MVELPVTGQLLDDWRAGDLDARDRLIRRLHPALTEIAAARLRRESDASLSTGDLVNEAVIGLMRLERVAMADRPHLLALAARMMRHILVDHARTRQASKRRHKKVELQTRFEGAQRLDLVALEAAMHRLAAIDGQLMELVEMRYFGGMTVADVSAVTGLSQATVKRRWEVARAWLTDALSRSLDHD